MKRTIRYIVVLLTLGAMLGQILPAAAVAPSNSAFRRVWERTDKPVAELQATRTWIWGPESFTVGLLEPYIEGPAGQREVQYFDKSRMELTNPAGDPDSAFYVTNGLLVVELVSGRLQAGDSSFEELAPAAINVAGDFDDASGPTYATFGPLLSAPAAPVGASVTQRVDRAGTLSDDPALGSQGIAIAYVDDVTQHAVAAPFWEFMNSSGIIFESGQLTSGALFANPFFATGRPISEPYWADVQVGGQPKLVLMQCFERRCLTYTPDNAPEWRVEAGNVGQHYYSWRYSARGVIPQPKPAPRIPAEASWSLLQPAGSTPSERRDHVLVADSAGARVYLHGGRSGDSALGDLWVYDVVANSWSQLAPAGGPPAARFGHNGAFDSANQRLLVFGGQAGTSFYSDLWAYDIAANSWQQLAGGGAGPLDRYGGGGAFDPVTGSFFVSHGFTSNGRFDDTWRFDVSGGGWSDVSAGGARPEPRCLLRVVADPARGRLLLFGGQSDSAPYLGDLWSFNLATHTWQQIGAPGPSPRNFYSMTLAGDGDYLLLHGGNAGGSASSELWLLDLTTDTWTLLPGVGQPPARSGHDMVWLAGLNTALVFGGGSAELWQATFN